MESKTEGTTWKSKKTTLETGVKNDVAFCLESSIEKKKQSSVSVYQNSILTSKNSMLILPVDALWLWWLPPPAKDGLWLSVNCPPPGVPVDDDPPPEVELESFPSTASPYPGSLELSAMDMALKRVTQINT